jgi:hypothetical protein
MAKFDTPDPLPDPESDQAVVKSTNRFGQFYSRRQSRGYRGGVDKPLCWTTPPFPPWKKSNWGLLSYLARRWKNTLTPLQHLAWDVLAGLVTWENYKGQPGTPTGFCIYMAFNLNQPPAGRFPSDNPPGAWDPTQKPVINSWNLWSPDDLDIIVAEPSPWAWYDIRPRAVVTRDPKLSGAYPIHFRPALASDIFFTGALYIFAVDLRCPLWPQAWPRETTVGVSYVHNGSGQFTNFSWLRIG